MSTLDALRRLMADPVNGNAAMVRRGQHLNTTFLLGLAGEAYYVTVRDGRVETIEQREKPLQAVSFAIKGGAEAWNAFWRPVPDRHSFDILGLAKTRRMTIEGDIKVLMGHLRYIKDLLAAPRGKMEALHG